MNRRILAVLGSGATLLALSSCATFDNAAAKVNGTEISTDDLQVLREGLATDGDPLQLGAEAFDANGDANGDLTRQALSLLIDNALMRQLLDHAGVPVTADQLAAADTDLASQGPELPKGVHDALQYSSAASAALATLPAPDPAGFEATYAKQPAALGAVCIQVVSAPTAEAADAAVAALNAGTDVPTADGTTADQGCAPVTSLGSALDPAVVAQLIDAKAGQVVGPVAPDPVRQTATWQVLQVLPYDKAADQLAAVIAQSPGPIARAAAFVNAHISIDSEYGVWDPTTQSVVAV